MPVTISGTSGVQLPLGSASAPSATNTTAQTTGVYYPTSTTLGLSTNGTNAVYVDASQNVGIGTTSPAASFSVVKQTTALSGTGNSYGLYMYPTSSGLTYIDAITGSTGNTSLGFRTYNNGTYNEMRIDSSGNVGIGTSSPGAKLDISGSSTALNRALKVTPSAEADIIGNLRTLTIQRIATDSVLAMGYATTPDAWYISASYGGTGAYKPLAFATSDTERMRIDSSGNLLVGTTDPGGSSGVGHKFNYSATVPSIYTVINTAGSSNTYHLYNTNATNNGFRFYVQVNGGIANYSANNSNISDERLKTNIELSGNYLDKICAIPVRTFKYKDQGDDPEKTLGVIAQEVEMVAPELVNNDGFGETPEDGVPLKTIYQTDLQYALMKAIQELSAKVDAQAAEIAALKAKVPA